MVYVLYVLCPAGGIALFVGFMFWMRQWGKRMYEYHLIKHPANLGHLTSTWTGTRDASKDDGF